jgi:hypothetical protein
VKNIGKPCAGELHARFDEGGLVNTTSSLLYLWFSMVLSNVVVNVEVVPPDRTNTERARRLNPEGALSRWIAEAAEQ